MVYSAKHLDARACRYPKLSLPNETVILQRSKKSEAQSVVRTLHLTDNTRSLPHVDRDGVSHRARIPLFEVWIAQIMDKPLDSISQGGRSLVAIGDPMVGALDGGNLRTIDLRPNPDPHHRCIRVRSSCTARPHPRSLTTGKYRHASYQASASIFDGTPRYLARIRPLKPDICILGIALRRNPRAFGHRRIDKGEYLWFEGQPVLTRKRNDRKRMDNPQISSASLAGLRISTLGIDSFEA